MLQTIIIISNSSNGSLKNSLLPSLVQVLFNSIAEIIDQFLPVEFLNETR